MCSISHSDFLILINFKVIAGLILLSIFVLVQIISMHILQNYINTMTRKNSNINLIHSEMIGTWRGSGVGGGGGSYNIITLTGQCFLNLSLWKGIWTESDSKRVWVLTKQTHNHSPIAAPPWVSELAVRWVSVRWQCPCWLYVECPYVDSVRAGCTLSVRTLTVSVLAVRWVSVRWQCPCWLYVERPYVDSVRAGCTLSVRTLTVSVPAVRWVSVHWQCPYVDSVRIYPGLPVGSDCTGSKVRDPCVLSCVCDSSGTCSAFLCVFVCLHFSVWLCLSICPSLSLSGSPSLSVCLSHLCLSLTLRVSLCLPVWVSLPWWQSLSLPVYVHLSIKLSLSVCLFLSLSLPVVYVHMKQLYFL